MACAPQESGILLTDFAAASRTEESGTPGIHLSVLTYDLVQPCACADNFAVAASSFRLLMTGLSPTFVIVDRLAGLDLNHQNCCWVQYGSENCHDLLGWVSTNCEELGEMKIVKYAKYVGTVIEPEVHIHRWTELRNIFPENQENKRVHQESCEATV